MNYFQKNRKNIIIAVISTLLAGSIIAILLQRNSVNQEDIVAAIYPERPMVYDSLNFEDKTENATSTKWDFGDGKTSEKRKGVHFYSKSGFYKVKLIIDNKFTKDFTVVVSDREVERQVVEDIATIDAQSQARQLEMVKFRAYAPNAKSFKWSFGESGFVDSRDQLAFYTYSKPGTYRVTLTTDNILEPVVHTITITPTYNSIEAVIPEIVPLEKDPEIVIGDDLKRVIQQIAYGNNFNSNFNYLLNKYMCNNDNVAVTVNGENVKSLYYYLTGLQFDKKNIIQEVTPTYDSQGTCVLKLDIVQSK